MPIWEYKVITSGKGGFASPALLEKYLNDLGREEWEIIEFHTQSDNFLAFTGLARRSTQRDWTLEDAAAAAAKAEAEKLRAEFEAKFKAATTPGGSAEEPAGAFLDEKLAPDDGFRKPIDTSHDADADDDEKDEDDWDKLTAAEEEELPTFFEAIRPHMRRNQRGPGMSVGVDYLAKKWGQSEDDLKGALQECGFAVPSDEDAKPEYLEFEGDLYWVNVNRRGELWINTKEKPRPVFRAVKAQKVAVEEEPKADSGRKPERKAEEHSSRQKEEASGPAASPSESKPENAGGSAAPTPESPVELPSGPALLAKIRPLMRRNRRGPGASGSASFLSRALKCREGDLVAGFKALGLVVPGSANEKAAQQEIENEIWWINVDSRGGIWINGREKKAGEVAGGAADNAATAAAEPGATETPQPAAAASQSPTEGGAPTAAAEAVPAPEVVPGANAESATPIAGETPSPVTSSGAGESVLARVRPRLKETRTGGFAAKLDRLAEESGASVDDLTSQLVGAGLAVPEKPREKPVFVELSGDIFWLNRNAKGELWLNAKASKFRDKDDEEDSEGEAARDADGERKQRRPRSRKKSE